MSQAANPPLFKSHAGVHGYDVALAEHGRAALEQITAWRPDVILLDLGLPEIDGLEVTRRVREWSEVPILVLSVRDREADKVAALNLGADDYVTKPFSAGELLARIQVALRHATHAHLPQEPVITAGDLRLNIALRQVIRREERIHLTPTQWEDLQDARDTCRQLTDTQCCCKRCGDRASRKISPSYGCL